MVVLGFIFLYRNCSFGIFLNIISNKFDGLFSRRKTMSNAVDALKLAIELEKQNTILNFHQYVQEKTQEIK